MSTIIDVYDAQQFPPTLLCTQPNLEQKVYQFGFVVPNETLKAYALRRSLVPESHFKSPFHSLCAISRSIRHLETVAHARLSHARPNDGFGRAHCVVSLYSNYNMKNRQMVEEDEQDVVEIIQRELGISDAPKWYWDRRNDSPDATLVVYEAAQFPQTLVRTKTNPDPTLYQFGILLFDKTLKDYALDRKLVTEDFLKQSLLHGLAAITRAVRHLQAVAQARLTHTFASDDFGREYSVVSLYSNYNMDNRRLVKDDEQDVVEILQRELHVLTSPKWYWDPTNDLIDADPPSIY
ncbi:hypothetical protein C8R47DRAFT_1207398 [Mycena vitilis]|nr:hypothetical protein C8R47DRAFT_1207398 [Mycena vitilis]